MTFRSILTPHHDAVLRGQDTPSCLVDLNLDQIIDAVVAGFGEYELKPDFHTPLSCIDAVQYRQEIMRDLEQAPVLGCVQQFTADMRAVRRELAQAQKLYYPYQKGGWFLDAVERYCGAVATLVRGLRAIELRSRGLLAFRRHLAECVATEAFAALVAETGQLRSDLAAVRYCLLITDGSIRVQDYDQEADYSTEIESVFDRFKQGAVKSYLVKFPASDDMNHVEAAVVDMVAKLRPDLFRRLDRFCTEHGDFVDQVVKDFDREIHFYLSYLAYIAPLRRAGLCFCYPVLSDASKEVHVRDTFDLALASKLVPDGTPIVRNDFDLTGPERISIVSGPNQGGKTTFARTIGQLHYLASLGCPIPGREARLFLCDRLFTHFEREEDIATLRGKLEDDLVRIHRILDEAAPASVIIMNEIFTSTTLEDAVLLSRAVLERLVRLDLICVWVTFIDELAAASPKAVSLVSTIIPGDPASRTFRIVRKPADGASYAAVLAEKYRLTYPQLRERLAS